MPNTNCRNWRKGDGFTCHLGGRAADCDGCRDATTFGVSDVQAATAHNLLTSIRDNLLNADNELSELHAHIDWMIRECIDDAETALLLDDIMNRAVRPLVTYLFVLRGGEGCIGQSSVNAYECVNQLRDRLRTLVKRIPITHPSARVPLRG